MMIFIDSLIHVLSFRHIIQCRVLHSISRFEMLIQDEIRGVARWHGDHPGGRKPYCNIGSFVQ